MEDGFTTSAMQRLCEEFSWCMKIHQDGTISWMDKMAKFSYETGVRVVLIQDYQQSYQHAGIIVNHVNEDFFSYPKLVLDFIEKNSKEIVVEASNVFISRNKSSSKYLVFTNSVYIYTNSFNVDEKMVRNRLAEFGMRLVVRDNQYWEEFIKMKVPDIFICHDSRDKENFVRPLVEALSIRLLKVWYDEFSLKVGDSLIDKIDEGLEQCKFGIVVVSKNFLTCNPWTKTEFNSLTAKEINANHKVILPIWNGVTRDEVARYSPRLASKFALHSVEGIEKIADKILREIKTPPQQLIL